MEHVKSHLATLSQEERTRIFQRAATKRRLHNALQNANDLPWLRSICEDLKERIHKLTPHRKDLRDEWETSFDVDLLMQMIEYKAVESKDVDVMIDLVVTRLELCCAPVQDEAVREAKAFLCRETNPNRKLATLVDIADAILRDIETLLEAV